MHFLIIKKKQLIHRNRAITLSHFLSIVNYRTTNVQHSLTPERAVIVTRADGVKTMLGRKESVESQLDGQPSSSPESNAVVSGKAVQQRGTGGCV